MTSPFWCCLPIYYKNCTKVPYFWNFFYLFFKCLYYWRCRGK